MRGRLVLLALISLVIAIPAYAAVMFIPVPMYMGVREPRVNIGDVSNFHNVAVLSAIGSGLRLGKKNFLFKEGGKVFPTITHVDPSSAVILVSVVIRIAATVPH